MSIQFRTRSQTPVDYSSYITNNNVTGCCYVYSNGEVTPTPDITLSACNQLNGYFVVGQCDSNNNIKPSSVGCCCSCQANEEGNPLTETTLCDCASMSGKWTLGECSNIDVETLCISGTPERSNIIDFRKKKACCHPTYTEDFTVYAECTDVCSEKECAEKTIYPYTSTFFNNGRKCDEQVGSAGPVSDECVLSDSTTRILNSCENGSNLFCWNRGGEHRCDFKYNFFDTYFPGKYVQDINQQTVQIRNTTDYYAILGTRYPQDDLPILRYAYSGVVGINKLCAGSLSFDNTVTEPDRYAEGYFAILDSNNVPRYYRSPTFITKYEDTPLLSPVPTTEIVEGVLDLIATRTFSIIVNTDNTVNIYGRFYDGSSNVYKTFGNFTTKLNKVFQHNTCPIGFDTHSSIPEYSTIGFVGQKTNKTYDYFSPFINDNPRLQQIRDIIRTLPAKDYVKVSFGANTFCGIDETGLLECVSLNSELLSSYQINKKYKHISCTATIVPPFENLDPNCDYCFAVDENNKFVKLSSIQIDFTSEPAASVTDVIGLSCYNSYCLAAVEPDENICNSQMLGSCCTCEVDLVNCLNPIRQGECTLLGGVFRQGGVCTDNYCNNIVNCNTTNTPRSIQVQSSLPTDELTYYEDGLYVGIFEPGSPINENGSDVNGTPLTGNSSVYKPTVFGYGTTSKKWAIIIAPNDYEITINNQTELPEILPSSLHDGLWNTYGDNINYFGIQSSSMEELRNNSRLSGWYLPSKHELEFINYKLNYGFFIPEVFKSFKSGIYLTSTAYFKYISDSNYDINQQIFNGSSFLYGQSFTKLNYGDIYLVPRTTKVNVRLIRRIELE